MNMDAVGSAYLLLDVGGTFIKSAVYSECGERFEDAAGMRATRSDASAEVILESIRGTLNDALEYMRRNNLRMCGMGLSFPGPFNYFTGVSMMRHKFEHLYGISILDYLRGLPELDQNVPIVFGHDANSALAGEMWKGAAKGCEQAAMVTLGTGLGFAFALAGKVQTNENGGPLRSVYSLPFRDGILEDYVSRRACMRRYAALRAGETAEVVQIADQARNGDSVALQVFREMAQSLAYGIRPILEENAMECLVLGGQISRSFDLFEATLREELMCLPSLKCISAAHYFSDAALLGILRNIILLKHK